jgi:hypothetical protein
VSAARIRVQVVYALQQRHWIRALELPVGATVGDAIRASGIEQALQGLQIDPSRIGVFGRLVALDSPLHQADRVEIYRPLLCDPKEVRRRRAAQQREA